MTARQGKASAGADYSGSCLHSTKDVFRSSAAPGRLMDHTEKQRPVPRVRLHK